MKPPRNDRESHAEMLASLTSESTAAQRIHDLHIPRKRESVGDIFGILKVAAAFAVVMLIGSMRHAVAAEPLKCGKGYAYDPMCATYEY